MSEENKAEATAGAAENADGTAEEAANASGMEEATAENRADPPAGDIKKRKGKTWKKVLAIVAAVVVVLLLTVTVGAYALFQHYYGLLDVVTPEDEQVESFTGDEDETDIADGDDDDSLSDEEVDELESQMAADQEELSKILAGEDTTETGSETEEDDNESTTAAAVSTVDTSNLYNLLIIGVDARSNSFSGRSDMIMLVTINKSSKKIVVTSILRDCYVSISGYKSNRINASYAFGGASLLISTIKQNIGITVDDYVVVNFFTVASLVDYVGGVSITVTADEISYMNSYIAEQNSVFGNASGTDYISTSSAGTLLLNGNQALAYGRIRYIGTDFARTERQRTVALAALQKVKTLSLSQLNTMAETYLPQVRTSLSSSDCLSLISLLLSVGDYSIETMTIPQSGTWSNATIRKMAVLSVNYSANYKAWLAKVQ